MARKKVKTMIRPEGSVAANARRIVAARTAAFFAREDALTDPAAAEELHAMRIEAKRLRYALELFGPVLGADVAWCLDSVKEFQAIAGEIHDADVRAAMLGDYLHARTMEQTDALIVLALDEDAVDVDALKTRLRAQVTAKASVAEQVALAAAIARTLAGRRERYADLHAQWTTWQEAGLHTRLDALGRTPASVHPHAQDDPAAFVLTEPSPEAISAH